MNSTNMLGSALVFSLLVMPQAWADEPLGESVKLLIQAQTLDPEAGKQQAATPNAVAAREVQKAIAMPGHRITSYNVCYTKLLRVLWSPWQ